MSEERDKQVPRRVAVCPECGGGLCVKYSVEQDYYTKIWHTELGFTAYCNTKQHVQDGSQDDDKWNTVLDRIYKWIPLEE
jgi:hypothetical protein